MVILNRYFWPKPCSSILPEQVHCHFWLPVSRVKESGCMRTRHDSSQAGKSLPAPKFIWVVALLLSGHGSRQELSPQSLPLLLGLVGLQCCSSPCSHPAVEDGTPSLCCTIHLLQHLHMPEIFVQARPALVAIKGTILHPRVVKGFPFTTA